MSTVGVAQRSTAVVRTYLRSLSYYRSPWPGEDGGPARLSVPRSGSGLFLQPDDKLNAVIRSIQSGDNLDCLGTMTVLGDPGEVFLLTHSMLRSKIGLPTTCRVERVDAQTLETICESPRLPGGAASWPGGMAVHRNGDLYVVYGRYVHRLKRATCEVVGSSFELPVGDRAYNSFVILDNGLLVTKDISDVGYSTLSVVDTDTMQPACAHIACPEASIARLSAVGNTVYVVGVQSVFRYHWDTHANTLVLDDSWRYDYIGGSRQTYGWDAVIDGKHMWFMDNGKHTYFIKMIGNGVQQTPNNLIRVSLSDASDTQKIPISGVDGGSVTNPPAIDVHRRIVVAFDSANRFLTAWRFDDGESGDSGGGVTLRLLWQKTSFGCASHMILYADSGEIVVNDYCNFGEEVVVLNVETGAELGRKRIGGICQGVVFPSAGFGRDFYWTTFNRLARVFVT